MGDQFAKALGQIKFYEQIYVIMGSTIQIVSPLSTKVRKPSISDKYVSMYNIIKELVSTSIFDLISHHSFDIMILFFRLKGALRVQCRIMPICTITFFNKPTKLIQ